MASRLLDDCEYSDLSSYHSGLSEESDSNDEEIATVNNNMHANLKIAQIQHKVTVEDDSSIGQLRFEGQFELEDEALTVKISPDRSIFAVGLSNGVIRVFEIEDKASSQKNISLKAQGEKLPCTAIVFTSMTKVSKDKSNQQLLAVYSSGYIRLWDYCGSSECSRLLFELHEVAIPCEFNRIREDENESNELLCVSISLDDSRFVTGGTDTIIKVYDFENKIRMSELRPGAKTGFTKVCNYHSSRVTALIYHPRGDSDRSYNHIFVSGSWDNSVHIWDDRQPGSLWQYYGPHVVGSDGLDIDGGRNLILTSSWRRSSVLIQMWKFADFALTTALNSKRRSALNYSKPVNEFGLEGSSSQTQGYVARFGNGGQVILFTGCNQNMLRIIATETMATFGGVNNLPNAIYSVDSCIDRLHKRRCMLVFTNANYVYLASFNARTTSIVVPPQ